MLGVGLAVWGSLRVRLDQDLTRFFPRESEFSRSAEILTAFHTVDQLVLSVSGGSGVADRVDAADDIGPALQETGLFARVQWRWESEEQLALYNLYFPRRFALLPPEEVASLLTPEGIREALQRTAAELISPQGSYREEALRLDPLGLGNRALERALQGTTAYRARLVQNHLLSQDETHLLILTSTKASSLDAEKATIALEAVEKAVSTLQKEPRFASLKVDALGGALYARESARTLKRDIALASSMTVVGLLLTFLLAFRNPLTLLLCQLPGVVAVGVAAAVLMAFQGTLSGITLGFGAAILGLSADYSIHLLTHTLVLEKTHPRNQALKRSLLDLEGSIAMGWFTTLISFLVLLLSRAGGLREIALFSGIGITCAYGLCMGFLPHLHSLSGRAWGRPLQDSWMARALSSLGTAVMNRPLTWMAGVLVVTLPLAIAAPQVRFNGDARDLLYEPPEVAQAQARFEAVWGGQGATAMVVVTGEDEGTALAKAEAVARVVEAGRKRGDLESFSSVTPLIPSPVAQAGNLAAWTGAPLEEVKARVRQEGEALGFTADAFDPFFASLADLSRNPPPLLTVQDVLNSSLAPQVERSLDRDPGRVRVLTTLIFSRESGDRGSDADAVFPSRLEAELRSAAPGVDLASRVGSQVQAVRQVKDEAVRLMILCFGVTALVLGLYYRAWLPCILALLPPVLALLWTFGAMALLNIPLHIVSICALVLIVGVGIDYGIYIVDACLREGVDKLPQTLRSTGTAVVLSSLATLSGFGTMAVARNPSLSTVGIQVVLGIIASLLASLVGVPALLRLFQKPRTPGPGTSSALILLGMILLQGCTSLPSPEVLPEARAAMFPFSSPQQRDYQVEMRLPGRSFVFTGYVLLAPGMGWVFQASTPMGPDLFRLTGGPSLHRVEVLYPPLRAVFRGEPVLQDLSVALVEDCLGTFPATGTRRCSAAEAGRSLSVDAVEGNWVEKRVADARGHVKTRVGYRGWRSGVEAAPERVEIDSREHRYRMVLQLGGAAAVPEWDASLFAAP